MNDPAFFVLVIIAGVATGLPSSFWCFSFSSTSFEEGGPRLAASPAQPCGQKRGRGE
jgi:hypothetical protein